MLVSKCLTRLQSMCRSGLRFHLKARLSIISNPSKHGVAKIQLLMNCRTETTCFPLAVSQGSPSVPSYMGLPVGKLTIYQVASIRVDTWESMRACRSWKPQSLYNLFLGVTSHHFCHILPIRIESLSQVPKQGEEITQGHEYQEVEITGSNLKSAYHHTRKHEKAFVVLSNTLSPPVTRRRQIFS